MKWKIWFTEQGIQVEVIQKYNNKFIVKPTWNTLNLSSIDDIDNFDFWDWIYIPPSEFIVDQVFDTLVDISIIKEYEAKKKSLIEDIDSLSEARQTLVEDIENQKQKLKNLTDMSFLVEILTWKIPTHFISSRNATIYTKEEILDKDERYDNYSKKRPIWLDIDINNKLRFVVFKYTDMSDWWSDEYIPAFSLEEAVEISKKIFLGFIDDVSRVYTICDMIKWSPYLKEFFQSIPKEKKEILMKKIEEDKKDYENSTNKQLSSTLDYRYNKNLDLFK